MSKIEEIPTESVPEEVQDAGVESESEEIADGSTVTVYSRAEKKARKALIKLGLKKVEGISRVVLRRGQSINFVIANPEVYRASNSSYIVFGEAKIEDFGALARQASALQAGAANANPADLAAAAKASGLSAEDLEAISKDPASIHADLEAAAAAGGLQKADEDIPEASEEELVEAGLTKDDIEAIKSQTTASNGAILKAFKENNKDVINTIVTLTA
ncbi:uncharacterized protein SAPINGB_P001883 [Magnusiomyces paraingens]|uniref:Nascent polypeptide-associated complex subunit alpha n=1 Tax=Magnusiomyces paraingens TaxID=2606893 RepID=A0A5E8BC43_9ASCO|nr:uncharacterized protein SAPINGB_P001883 [Saprochaete ingens]VVT48650.1 unnamed protein product [Saprochaete ingens]